MSIYQENYLVVKKMYKRRSPLSNYLDVVPPASAEELDYQTLMTESNNNFFHREYTIALQNYQDLRQKILYQSHPEMPGTLGGQFILPIDVSRIAFDPIVELGRRYLEKVNPVNFTNPTLKNERIIPVGDFAVNPIFKNYNTIGLDAQLRAKIDFSNSFQSAREWVLKGDMEQAVSVYKQAKDNALKIGDLGLAAQLASESGAMLATYSKETKRKVGLDQAEKLFTEAADLYQKTGDTNAHAMVMANIYNVSTEQGNNQVAATAYLNFANKDVFLNLDKGVRLDKSNFSPNINFTAITIPSKNKLQEAVNATTTVLPQTTKAYYTQGVEGWQNTVAVLSDLATVTTTNRQLGLFTPTGVKTLPVERVNYKVQIQGLYDARRSIKELALIDFYEEIQTNYVAYIPHLFFFVLPIAIGDTYLAMGLYSNAEAEYLTAAKYTFINESIEVPYLWLRMADTAQRWGDELFRQGNSTGAKIQYEKIVKTDLTLPASVLYQAKLATMNAPALEAIKEIKEQPHATVNYRVYIAILQAYQQLTKIQNALNFLGFADDYYPIFRYRYLQSVANYMAEQAVQAERTFINFRVAAENQKFERLQLQNNLEVNKAGLRIEQKRLEDASLEAAYAQQSRVYAELRANHADDSVNDWLTDGRDLASMNAALAWASNAGNKQKINYTGVRYDGESHNFSGTVAQFYDDVGERREYLNYELQLRRLERQAAEIAAEVGLSKIREQQAKVRYQTQQMAVRLAEKRVEGAQELLDFSKDKMFNEELWFRLAAELRDISRQYLDMAIYAAFLMERAYDMEFDRRLNRIRLDYGIGGVEGLLGGDYLKRDIDSFTLDYLQNAQKKNPVRLVMSMRQQFPAAFNNFVQTGLLPFRTDLEIFDRLYPGTYRRKIKKIEVIVEGLIPTDGTNGFLLHQGVSTEWRKIAGTWQKFNRITSPETMVLSNYQFRRDISVFQPADDMLGQFENLGLQGNWTFELPRSSNNLDYQTISDIKFILYFDADFNTELRQFINTFYTNEGGSMLILSSRFHFPDQYFRLDAEKSVAFDILDTQFANNYTDLKMTALTLRLITAEGKAIPAQPLSITRKSDMSTINAATDVNGLITGNSTTMAPFDAWHNTSPNDVFTISFPDDFDTTKVGDVHLSIGYNFKYRPDGILPA
jgi:hypothetical protein